MKTATRLSKNTVLITGIRGYAGRVLLPFLEKDEGIQRIIGIDTQEMPVQNVTKKLEFYQLDTRKAELDDLLIDVDIVIHLAFHLMRLPGTSQSSVEQKNIENTIKVFEAASRQKVGKIIFTSSVTAYGIHPDNPVPLNEQSPLRPNSNNYYSLAKAAVEQYLDTFEKSNPDIIVTRFRPCTVIGPNADPAQMVSFTNNTAVMVRGFDPQYQLLHEDDLAQAIYLAIKENLAGIFNVSPADYLRLSQIVQSKPGGRVVSFPYGLSRFLAWLSWITGASVFAPEWLDLARFSIVVSNQKYRNCGWSPQFNTLEAYEDLLASTKTI